MRGKSIKLSPQRQLICDLLRAARAVPAIPVQRRMNLSAVVAARQALPTRPSWLALFTRSYARIALKVPELRRAYVKIPRPHLYEYPANVACLALEREYLGEKAVFIGRIREPGDKSIEELNRLIRHYQEVDIGQCKDFQRGLTISRLPTPLRRFLWWLGLNIGRQRANFLGTFGVSAYSALGAESLMPLSPLTSTLTYGVFAADGTVDVRIIYDHRVMDGATVARVLQLLEEELNGGLCAELRSLNSGGQNRADSTNRAASAA
jgi:hypothetical protein